jgi:hypothetical protein
MYALLKFLLPPPLAEVAIVFWYLGLLFLVLYFGSLEQARFAYAEF